MRSCNVARASRTFLSLAAVTAAVAVGQVAGAGSASATASICDAVSGNLVHNCGFETGDLTSWTFASAATGSDAGIDDPEGGGPNSGVHWFGFGATGVTDDSISQTLTGTTPGATYQLKFFLASLDSNNDFTASIQNDAAGASDIAFSQVGVPVSGYAEHDYTFTAGAGAPTIVFAGRNPPSWLELDDISVTQTGGPPVGPPPPPPISVVSSKNPSTSGDAVTFTGTVGAPGSPVPTCGTFSWLIDNAAPPAGTPSSGSGSTYTLGPISNLAVGVHPVTLAFSGCATAGPGSGSVNQEVDAPAVHGTVTNPTINAYRSVDPNRNGWNTGPVTVTFTCMPGSSPMATPCPDPVTVSQDGAGQKVTGTVTDTDGGSASVTVTINIDREAPTLRVTGARDGKTYRHDRQLHCIASDALSGVQSCVIVQHHHTRHGVTTVHWTAVATDKAGNKTTEHGEYSVNNS